jgi:ferric-dicitrate binding protein FerR (iron transport regulator)
MAEQDLPAEKKIPEKTIPSRSIIPIWARWAAAAVLILLGGSIWFLTRNTPVQPPLVTNPAARENDALPGGNKAILTLAGGQQILLDSAQQGNLTVQGNAQVSKTNNGKLVYQSAGSSPNTAIVYNTLTIPRGGQYQLTLPDGTQVWLNAASSITYPTAFTGKERKVTITGEAYFEVAKNANKPFLVEENNLTIKVLGTRFDVSGYDNEPVRKTVLVEGSVSILYKGTSTYLEPGMQAQVNRRAATDNRTPALTVAPANIEQTLAWKNGFFAFTNADLPTVMRQIARWYDVDVTYEGSIPKDAFEFNGKIGRTLTLDQVLKLLTKTRVHYTIEGRQLTIRP